MRKIVEWIGLWAMAAIVTAAIGSIVQTWVNMNAIADLGAPVPLGERLQAIAADLVRFGPVWTVLVALALLPALALAGVITGRVEQLNDVVRRQTFFSLGAFIAVLVLLVVMNSVAPMTPIAATRSLHGMIGMALPGLAGGWLFARYRRPAGNMKAAGAFDAQDKECAR